MTKFSVDYANIQSRLSKKRVFKLSEVQHKLKKVAFDVVRFKDSDDINDLWKIHREGDEEYIVAMYEEKQEKKAQAAPTLWSAIPDTLGNNINICYKKNPIKKLAISSMGILQEDAWMVAHRISQKLANDENFRQSLIQELTEEEKTYLSQLDCSVTTK